MTQPDVPKPQPLTDRATRVTALVIIGRVHTGRGTSPDRLAREAEALIPWLASGKLPEPSAVITTDEVIDVETDPEVFVSGRWRWRKR